MGYGLDYSFWRPPSPSWLLQNGYSFVCRYLSWLPNGKVINKSEYDGLRAAGVSVVLNWEYTGDISGGYNQGVQEAQEAQRQAALLGAWPCPILFSADHDPSYFGQATVISYVQGTAAVLGANNNGLYGGYNAVAWAMQSGYARYGWQTFAWSTFGLKRFLVRVLKADKLAHRVGAVSWYGPAQLRQIPGGSNDYDLDQNMIDDFGQVGAQNVVTTSGIADFTQQQMEVM